MATGRYGHECTECVEIRYQGRKAPEIVGKGKPLPGFNFCNEITSEKELIYVKEESKRAQHEKNIFELLEENQQGLTAKEVAKKMDLTRDNSYGIRAQHEKNIFELLEENQQGLTAKEVAKKMDLTRDNSYGILEGMVRAGRLDKFQEKRGPSRPQNIYIIPETKETPLSLINDKFNEMMRKQEKTIGKGTASIDIDKLIEIRDKTFLDDLQEGLIGLAVETGGCEGIGVLKALKLTNAVVEKWQNHGIK
jgi:predicted transcriptional regulator